MQYNEIKELDRQEIVDKIADLKKELFNLRLQKSFMQLKDSSQFRKVKKDIARHMHALSSKSE